jgi:hypothetical protein
MKPSLAQAEVLAALRQIQNRRVTSANPFASGTVGQILERLGIPPQQAEQCSLVCEALEESQTPPSPELIADCLAALPPANKTRGETPRNSDKTSHPDPFFSAVNYNSKRYGITAVNYQTTPAITFQDWRDADECREGEYQILDAWDSKKQTFLSPKEIQVRLQKDPDPDLN